MPAYEYAPHELLAPYIDGFVYNERHFVAPNDSFDILPDTSIEFVWNLGVPCFITTQAGSKVELPACYVVGLLLAPITIHADGLVQVVRARFYPWGFQSLLGDSICPSQNVQGLLHVSGDLQPRQHRNEAVQDAGQGAVQLLQNILLQRALAATLGDADAIRAAQALLERKGDITINELASCLSIPARTLRRRFQSTFGLSAKKLARLSRFQQVRNTLWYTPTTSLAQLALDVGYSDQAHLQREFRHFSRRTPGEVLDEMQQLRSHLTSDAGRNLQDAS